MSSHVDLAQSKFVVVLVVQNVHKISIEWMDLFELWKLCKYEREPIMVILLGVFDLSSIELTDTTDAILLVNNSRRLALRLG